MADRFISSSVSLREEQWQAIDELKGSSSRSEVCRDIVQRGILAILQERIVLIDTENKKLLRQKLKQRQGKMIDALNLLEASLRENNEDTTEVVAQALETLRECLTD